MLSGYVLPMWAPWCESLFLSPLWAGHPSPWRTVLQVPLVPPLHLHPSYLLWSDSPVYLTVESFFCQTLHCCLGYLHPYECYLVVSMGWGELRASLPHHLAQKSLNILLHMHAEWAFLLISSWKCSFKTVKTIFYMNTNLEEKNYYYFIFLTRLYERACSPTH